MSAIVLAGAVFAAKAMLSSYVRAELAKQGVLTLREDFGTEVSPELLRAIMWADLLQRFLVPLLLVLAVLPVVVAAVWRKKV